MVKRIFIAVTVLIVIFSFIACKQPPISEGKKIRVATTIFPVYDITRNITGDKADVFFVIPIGANPHTYEPIPSMIKELKRAHLIIGVHNELDGWIEDYVAEGVKLKFLKEEEHEGAEHPEETTTLYEDEYIQGEEAHHHDNPHIWLTVKGAKAIAQKIAVYLSNIDGKNSEYYQGNLHMYQRELDELDIKIANLFKNVQEKKFIQWHPAWDFFAEDYGLEIIGSIEKGHGYEPSVQEFKALVEKAKSEKVKIIVIGLNVESKATEALAREIDGMLVRLDSIGDPHIEGKAHYIKLMYNNAKKLAEALKK